MYNHLIREDDNETSKQVQPCQGNSERRRKVVYAPRAQTYRLTTVILGILCAVLISIIIGLCVNYNGLSTKHSILSQNSSVTNSDYERLKANYSQLTATLMKAQRNFQEAVGAKDSMQLERDRERRQKELLQRQKEALLKEETNLQARITTLQKSCERCPAGWVLLRLSCYFFSSIGTGKKTWHQSREECKKSGADLAVIDNQEKQEFISRIVKGAGDSGSWHVRGYWIGLSDIHSEGAWKWLNGSELTRGFWFDGEPNDQYSGEDCGATYPKQDPLKTWNDAPCDFELKWICEIKLQ
ncbi:hypothetical protein GJAV_G00013210 [Gymnothorax javanicus]|nr:hypothetical protein GJAV_G00013210 [Gymnothorax javanicus]